MPASHAKLTYKAIHQLNLLSNWNAQNSPKFTALESDGLLQICFICILSIFMQMFFFFFNTEISL